MRSMFCKDAALLQSQADVESGLLMNHQECVIPEIIFTAFDEPLLR